MFAAPVVAAATRVGELCWPVQSNVRLFLFSPCIPVLAKHRTVSVERPLLPKRIIAVNPQRVCRPRNGALRDGATSFHDYRSRGVDDDLVCQRLADPVVALRDTAVEQPNELVCRGAQAIPTWGEVIHVHELRLKAFGKCASERRFAASGPAVDQQDER